MSNYTARALSRRRVLLSGSAAMGAALFTPAIARSASQPAFPQGPSVLAFDGPTILAASSEGLFRQLGAEWDQLDTPGNPTAVATHPDRPGTIFAGWQNGTLLRSHDEGRNWVSVDAGLPGAPILSLTLGAQTPGTLYSSIRGDGIWRSEDDGETWEFVMDRPYLDGAEHDVLSLVSVANETGMGGIWLYAGTPAGLTRVPDCFCRWQDVVAGDAMDALVTGEAPLEAAKLPSGEPIEILALAPHTPERIYAALPSGLWLSTDAGVNWAQVTPDPVTALAVDPTDPLHVVTVEPSRLRMSRDGGTTWAPFNQTKDN
ncbi:exo-alpha-sialidase [Cribrihabitans neustonicus]|uniref:WD40/YVTN/BNR-like repeat-containing protein n=1 Tax=Cribrihabitans neustonicus TaxID=1429085 RepID=UPI003B5AE62B